jgi:hypothetical protein
MRMALTSDSDRERVLQVEGWGLTIGSITYYNTMRHNGPSSEDCQVAQGLLVCVN